MWMCFPDNSFSIWMNSFATLWKHVNRIAFVAMARLCMFLFFMGLVKIYEHLIAKWPTDIYDTLRAKAKRGINLSAREFNALRSQRQQNYFPAMNFRGDFSIARWTGGIPLEKDPPAIPSWEKHTLPSRLPDEQVQVFAPDFALRGWVVHSPGSPHWDSSVMNEKNRGRLTCLPLVNF